MANAALSPGESNAAGRARVYQAAGDCLCSMSREGGDRQRTESPSWPFAASFPARSNRVVRRTQRADAGKPDDGVAADDRAGAEGGPRGVNLTPPLGVAG